MSAQSLSAGPSPVGLGLSMPAKYFYSEGPTRGLFANTRCDQTITTSRCSHSRGLTSQWFAEPPGRSLPTLQSLLPTGSKTDPWGAPKLTDG